MLAAVIGLSAQPVPLTVERDDELLRLKAPGLRFLVGEPLERLHDGRSVTYVLTASIRGRRGGPRLYSLTRHVTVSYDLWEERFSVVRPDDRRVAAWHLTTAAAEAWCVDLLSLPVRAAPGSGAFVVELVCSLREDDAQAADAPPATTFTGLVDLFSRKARPAPPRWEAASLPLRLADLADRNRK